jgi:hypothetical protein
VCGLPSTQQGNNKKQISRSLNSGFDGQIVLSLNLYEIGLAIGVLASAGC